MSTKSKENKNPNPKTLTYQKAMAVLSFKQILQEKKTNDPNSIAALTLTHKALSDVSCLREFKNLERLDLGFNNLNSLDGLSSCVNVKWLSVVQNKLESLKGIEGLSKLNVLNAGKNKLKSMNEVRSLVSLRALILNENEIVSICKLDQMKELNTLVLSRNPISQIGDALFKTKSMTKLSLSNCKLESIGSSLKSCTELKELRLAHNDIKTLPVELAHNTKLQNLDLGNNLITKWSDLKVLSSLIYLKNLNLQANPIGEKESLAKKIKKLLPNLHVFNARPTDKTNRKESDRPEDSSIDSRSKKGSQEDVQIDPASDHKKPKKLQFVHQSADMFIDNKEDLDMKGLSSKKQKSNEPAKDGVYQVETGNAKNLKKKLKRSQLNESNISVKVETLAMDRDAQIEGKRKKQKTDKKALDTEGNETSTKKEPDGKSEGKVTQRESDVLDDSEVPFTKLFANNVLDMVVDNVTEKTGHKISQGIDANVGIVTISTKKMKKKNQNSAADALQLSVDAEVGLGGPSTWD